MTAIIDNPKQLRSKIVVWAISTNVTDLIETMPPLGEYTYGIFLNFGEKINHGPNTVSENECRTPSKEHNGNEAPLKEENLSLRCCQSLD